MKFQAVILLFLCICIRSWGECISLPPKKCIELKFLEMLTVGKKSMCLGLAILSDDKSQKKIFFHNCPKIGMLLRGDPSQRSDITAESMAQCNYEFKENQACKINVANVK